MKNSKKINDFFDNEKKQLFKKIYSKLSAWQKVQVSRHSDRPHTLDYTKNIFKNVIFLHGDKKLC